jgi:hydrogenase expression/formation protein HypD
VSSSSPEQLLAEIRRHCTQSWTLMEVCGGQTHALLRHGIDQLLPAEIHLIHGPGCPVCVTASERIDQALELAARPEVILCSFGDMLRVPGRQGRNLLAVRAEGGDVRVVYSPLDVLAVAQQHPDRLVVFLAVGFETTAPATALLARRALLAGVPNLTLLVCHVRVPPVLHAMLNAPQCQVQGLLAAGNVCAVMGQAEYNALAAEHRRPIVVTGFSAMELLQGILQAVDQLERGSHRVENGYRRAAAEQGNHAAQALIQQVFHPIDCQWRGLGWIPGGGLALREPFASLAVERRVAPPVSAPASPEQAQGCISGLVLQGLARPSACPHFRRPCTPEQPLGAPMVSSEGACAAYYRYQR